MQSATTSSRVLAIAAALAFTAGALVILFGDTLARPSAWTIYHALTILTVAATITAGHLMPAAWHDRRPMAAVGFLVLFLAGTGLVVYQSVGRQAETSDTRTLSVEARNKAISDKQTDLDTSRQRLADAESQVAYEIAGRPDKRGRPTSRSGCGGNCQDWKQRAAEVRSHIHMLEAELATLGAPTPVAPKAAKMAAVLALFGADEARTKVALLLIEPFLWTLFFEIGSVISIGFASRRDRTPASVMIGTAVTDRDLAQLRDAFFSQSPAPLGPPRPPRGGKPVLVPSLPARAEHPLIDELRRGGPAASQDELARRMGLSKGEVSKTVSELANRLTIERDGRCNRIALAA